MPAVAREAVARLHDDEVAIDDVLVRALVDRQFPEWADQPVRRLTTTGTDNAIYRLGDDLAVRLPRIGWAQHQVDLEHEWLPRLAPSLPVPVPEPIAVGELDADLGYPYRWLVYRWLDGADGLALGLGAAGAGAAAQMGATGVRLTDGTVSQAHTSSTGDDWTTLAVEVAGFVTALRAIDPAGAPPARSRSGPLEPADRSTRAAIEVLAGRGELDADRAVAVWDAGLAAAPWPGPPVWTHGDLLPGNLLVRGGHLVGVIDWSAACVGDPACDAMLAWSLPPEARAAYRSALGVDDDSWARARAWSLQQAAMFVPYYEATIPEAVAAARRRIAALLDDDDESGQS